MPLLESLQAGWNNEPLTAVQKAQVGPMDYPAATVGLLGNYMIKQPVSSLIDLGDYLTGKQAYTPQDVTERMLDVGMLSAPVASMTMPRGAIGSGGGRLKTGSPFSGNLYHGTTEQAAKGIVESGFKPRTSRSAWFADDPGYAMKYAESRDGSPMLLSADVKMEKPLVIDMKGGEGIPKKLGGLLDYANSIEDVVGVARQQGYDGVIFKNRKKTVEGFSSNEYAIFDPKTQMKIKVEN